MSSGIPMGRGHMRKYLKIPPIPALGHLQKSKKHLLGEVPKRRRQLGGTEKLGCSKKHIFGGSEAPQAARRDQKAWISQNRIFDEQDT